MMWRAPLVRPPDDEAMATRLTELRRLERRRRRPGSPIPTPAAPPSASACASSARSARWPAGARRPGDGSRRRPPRAPSPMPSPTFGARRSPAHRLRQPRRRALAVSRRRWPDAAPRPAVGVDALDEHLEVCSFALHRLNRAQGSDGVAGGGRRRARRGATVLAGQLLPATRRPCRTGRWWSSRPACCTACRGRRRGARGRPVSVSPSLSAWSVAATARGAGHAADRRRHQRARDQPAGFVAGPALQFADAEVARRWPARTRRRPSCRRADATADGVLDLFGRSELVHLACHGSFRTDNPLFSTLAMADGPLTVYDLERVRRRCPRSSCSRRAASARRRRSTAGRCSGCRARSVRSARRMSIAPLTPVNDERVMAVMRRFHDGLAAGLSPPAALAGAARTSTGGSIRSAAAFVVIGA